MNNLSCFKAYDIRGIVGEELTPEIVYKTGRAFCQLLNLKKIVVGFDNRLSSELFKDAFLSGAVDAGCSVIDLGQCGTEEMYFTTGFLDADGGAEITASHNPIEYNGIKMVKKGVKPVSVDELLAVRAIVESGGFVDPAEKGKVDKFSCVDEYVKHLFSFIDLSSLSPLKVVVDSGNGTASKIVDKLEAFLPSLQLIKINHELDGSFPNGVPNPLLPEKRNVTSNAVRESGADLGVAWDGDFDRCFFYDENGEFIEGYYIVGLLAEAFLKKERGANIIYDPRLVWNTIDQVSSNGGNPIVSRTGHAFVKKNMRENNAVYGGEMSAHHYFRDFYYCDSGMIPWLLIVELLSKTGMKLSDLVKTQISSYPVSGEINFKVDNTEDITARVIEAYRSQAVKLEYIDGVSVELANWRFNLRSSNTESLLRLNIETKGDKKLLNQRVEELSQLILTDDENYQK